MDEETRQRIWNEGKAKLKSGVGLIYLWDNLFGGDSLFTPKSDSALREVVNAVSNEDVGKWGARE